MLLKKSCKWCLSDHQISTWTIFSLSFVTIRARSTNEIGGRVGAIHQRMTWWSCCSLAKVIHDLTEPPDETIRAFAFENGELIECNCSLCSTFSSLETRAGVLTGADVNDGNQWWWSIFGVSHCECHVKLKKGKYLYINEIESYCIFQLCKKYGISFERRTVHENGPAIGRYKMMSILL